MSHALTLITFIPIAGMALILALPDSVKSVYKWIAVGATVPQLAIALYLYEHFDTTTTAVQFAEKTAWMPSYHITYFMGVDGISISMVLLTAIIMFISVFASFGINRAEKRYYAAIKFFLYTLLGSVLILLAMLGLYYYGATPTFDLTELAANSSHYSVGFQRIVWVALFIGFAIKIPAFPFHTWLPDAHVEAPTA